MTTFHRRDGGGSRFRDGALQLAPLTPDDVRIDLLHGRAALDGGLEPNARLRWR